MQVGPCLQKTKQTKFADLGHVTRKTHSAIIRGHPDIIRDVITDITNLLIDLLNRSL